MTSERGFTFVSAYDESPKERGFTFIAHDQVPEKNKYIEKAKDYGKTALKGTIEGLSRFGQMLSGTQPGDITPEEQAERLDVLLPTEDDFGQRGLRRGLQMAPSAIAFPGSALSTLPRSIAAGFLGEGAKDLGLPEWAQTAAEITAFLTPDVTKKLLEKGSNAEIIKSAKDMGISDEALTPLLQSEFKEKWLSKLTPRRGGLQESLKRSRKETLGAYETLSKSDIATSEINPETYQKLMTSMGEKLFEMPSGVRNKVKEDFRDLVSRPVTGSSLMNFYSDINHYYAENAKQLGLLKGPIKDALSSISPQLGKDFETVNKLLHKYHKISQVLKPNLKTDIMEASEALGTLFGIVTGDYGLMYKIAGERTARELAKQLLTNPRLQQMGLKTAEAMNKNKAGTILNLADLFAHELEDISPEIAEKLRDITGKELNDFLSHSEKEDKT